MAKRSNISYGRSSSEDNPFLSDYRVTLTQLFAAGATNYDDRKTARQILSRIEKMQGGTSLTERDLEESIDAILILQTTPEHSKKNMFYQLMMGHQDTTWEKTELGLWTQNSTPPAGRPSRSTPSKSPTAP